MKLTYQHAGGVIVNEANHVVADVNVDELGPLLASAPDLLEACYAALDNPGWQTNEMVRAAITKATKGNP